MKQNEMNSQKAQELTKEELTHRGQVPQVHQGRTRSDNGRVGDRTIRY